MSFLPPVVSAEYRDEFRLQLRFNDGTTETVDFSEWLKGPIFEPLQDIAYFRRFFLEGGTVSWPNGADVAPETLYEAASRERRSKRSQPAGAPRDSTESQGCAAAGPRLKRMPLAVPRSVVQAYAAAGPAETTSAANVPTSTSHTP